MPKRRSRPEDAIQRAVFDHIRSRGAPDLFAWHTPNGGKRRPIEAAILKGLGARAGVPDIIAIHNGKCFAMELKAPDGRPTLTQLETIARLEKAGAYTVVCYGLDPALRVLECWGLLRGQASVNSHAPEGLQTVAAHGDGTTTGRDHSAIPVRKV